MRSLLCRGWGGGMGYQLTKRFVVKKGAFREYNIDDSRFLVSFSQ